MCTMYPRQFVDIARRRRSRPWWRSLFAIVALAVGLTALAVGSPTAGTYVEAAGDPAIPSGWVEVALGTDHSCVLSAQGEVKCWGLGLFGRLGYGDSTDRGDNPGEMGDDLPAVDLGTGRTATAIAVGEGHSCALLDNGHVKCWGFNLAGTLGIGDTDDRGDDPGEMGDNLPTVDLGTGRTATAITAGGMHTCALLDNNEMKCWGGNPVGALGLGDTVHRGDDPGEMGDNLPAIDLGTDVAAVAISAGNGHTCALLDNDLLKCWGWNLFGQLGLGDDSTRGEAPGEMGDNLPRIDLGTGRSAVAVQAMTFGTCALLDDASVKCWGDGSGGQLGNESPLRRGDDPGEMGDALPVVQLGTGRSAKAMSAAGFHGCAQLDDRSVKCWGVNEHGQLGQGDIVQRGSGPGEMGDNLAPIDFGVDRVAIAVVAGDRHTCAVLDNNLLKCWGYNLTGQLGLDDTSNRGNAPNEMGDELPRVDLGTGFVPDPVGVDTFRPARLVETRPSRPTADGQQQSIGRRTAGQVTEVQVAGRVGIGEHVDAAIVNVGIVAPSDQGFAVAYPCDQPRPAASTINHQAGQTIANAATVALSASGSLCVYTHRATDLIVDVLGAVPNGSTLDPINPARFIETRAGQPTTDGQFAGIGRRAAGQETVVKVAGRNGVPNDASAVTVNAIAIDPEHNGFLAAYPCGESRPEASMLNYAAGETIAGGATIEIGDGGAICVYSHRALDLVVDVAAYTSRGSIVATNVPARLVETRLDRLTVDGIAQGIGRRAAGQVTEIQVVGRAGVSAAATAGVFSIAAVDPAQQGYVVAYPCDADRPEASNLNHRAGRTIANNATIELSRDGSICVFTQRATDLVVDLTAVIR